MNAEYYMLLREFLSFKTLSLDYGLDYVKEHKKCWEWLQNLFVKYKFNVKIVNWLESPIVIAQYNVADDAETWIIYGHYDVNNAYMRDGWKDDPFSLYFWKDKIIGRGVASGKATTLLNMFNIFRLIQEWQLRYNVIFMIEWEYFQWSKNLKKLLKENKFKADFFFSNIWTLAQKNPVLTTWFRWSFSSKITLKSAEKTSLVSQYGWMLQNPIHDLSRLLSKIYDSNGRITIPYFYYEMDDLSANEKTLNARFPFDKELVLQEFWVKTMKLEDIDYYSKNWWKPCIEVTSFISWDSSFSTENIQPSASAILNFKLVPNQKVDAIKSLFQEWVKGNLLSDIDYELTFSGEAEPIKLDISNYFANRAETLLRQVSGEKVWEILSGFSLPIAKDMLSNTQNIVNIPLVNVDSNIDWINENLDVVLLEKWTEFLYEFFRK